MLQLVYRVYQAREFNENENETAFMMRKAPYLNRVLISLIFWIFCLVYSCLLLWKLQSVQTVQGLPVAVE